MKDGDELSCTILDGRCLFESVVFNLTHCDTIMEVGGQDEACVDAGTDAKPFIDLIGSGTTVSILTTIQTQLMAENNLSEEAAFEKMTDAFPKLVNVSINNGNPVQGQLETVGSELQLHVNHIGTLSMVNSVMSQIISTLKTVQADRRLLERKLSNVGVMAAATKSFTASIVSSSADEPLDLTDTTAIVTVINKAFEAAEVDQDSIPDVATLQAIASSTAAINTMTKTAVESVDTSSSGGASDLMTNINTFNYMAQVSLEEESKKLVTGEITVESFKTQTDTAVLKESAEKAVATVKAKRPTPSPTAMPTIAPTAAPTAAPTHAVFGTVAFDLQVAAEKYTTETKPKFQEAVATSFGVLLEQVELTVATSSTGRRLASVITLRVVVNTRKQDQYLSISAKVSDGVTFASALSEELGKLGVVITAENLVVSNVALSVPVPDPDTASGGSSPVGIIVGVLVAIIALAFLVYLKKRPKKGGAAKAEKIYNDDTLQDMALETPQEGDSSVPPAAEPPAIDVPAPTSNVPAPVSEEDEDDPDEDDFENNILGPPTGLMGADDEFEDDDDSDEYDSDDDDDLAAANILGPPAWIAESWRVESESETDGGLTSGAES